VTHDADLGRFTPKDREDLARSLQRFHELRQALIEQTRISLIDIRVSLDQLSQLDAVADMARSQAAHGRRQAELWGQWSDVLENIWLLVRKYRH
jgi:hypothetical protein